MGNEPDPSAIDHGAAILGRIIGPEGPPLNREAARSLLELTFAEADKLRLASLLARNQEGQLDADERAELDEYLRADAFLSVLKSKARASLKRSLPER